MQAVIAGGHGTIAMYLTRMLNDRGDRVISLIRNPDHSDEVRAAGAAGAVVCDLEEAGEDAVAEAVGSADAVVFAAGSGPGSGAERKWTMDHGGAVKLIEAAKRNGIPRYAIVSSIGADPDHGGDEVFDIYLRAKGKADAELAASGLDHAIVRPGALTDDPGRGLVEVGPSVERGEISREDVAAVFAALLAGDRWNTTFELVGGETPIDEALATL